MGDHEADGRNLSGPLPAGDPTPEALEAGRLLFAQQCDFVAAAMTLDRLPEPGLPEVAVVGRSNVGKSSLLNALTGRRALARTSHTPGRTQQLNFFDLGGRLLLVDMPGYGYAQAPKGEIKRWTSLIRAYLRGRVTLRRLYLLVDSRHGLKPADLEHMALLDEAAVSYRLVLTKIDKVKDAAELAQCRAAVEDALRKHTAALPAVIETSAHDGFGVSELRADIAALAEPAGA